MIQNKEIVINGNTYTVTQMPARRALKVQAKLMKLLGGAFSHTITAKDKQDMIKQFPKIISLLVEQIDEKTFDSFVMELVEYYVRKNGKEITDKNFDLEFAGSLNELFLLLQFILEVNFSDFFSEGGIMSDLMPQEAEQEQEVEQ